VAKLTDRPGAIDALVTATYSRRMRVRLSSGEEVPARIRGKRLKPVCGDFVHVQQIEREHDWLITAINDRRNALTRPDLRGRIDILAANIDLVVVVAAARPAADWYVVDRYLCAAELMPADALVVYNKTDLDGPGPADASELGAYREIGYTTVPLSAKTGDGIDELESRIGDAVAIVVGQSGVGKSTIINRIVGDAGLRTAEISARQDEGRHTTVNSVMLALDGGGSVIDSPGVRDYAPAIDDVRKVGIGFREIEAAAHRCRFADCSHRSEPDCAVRRSVDTGTISARRYESYRRLYALTERLGKRY